MKRFHYTTASNTKLIEYILLSGKQYVLYYVPNGSLINEYCILDDNILVTTVQNGEYKIIFNGKLININKEYIDSSLFKIKDNIYITTSTSTLTMVFDINGVLVT